MTATNQFAAHVGLDWADKKHDVCVQFKNGERVFHVIEHTAEALDVWLTELHQKVKGRIAIALELKKGPVVYALQKYPFITVFPVHALSLARYRQAFSPSGAGTVAKLAMRQPFVLFKGLTFQKLCLP
ncbi:IS110 family transposase, partial [Klebsiella pneumoniae]|uniref:IS110 family transposase n=1 Tax=Klebsiella pneumoniae TaxID=573 RepID=UPI002015F6AB